jgi:glycosyltransferase involved in cell wall biosynthesis
MRQRAAKILYIAGGLDRVKPYGAELCLLELIAGLDRARFHPCCAVTSGDGPYVDALCDLGVAVPDLRVRAGLGIGIKSAATAFRTARRLLAIAGRIRPDLIHVNSVPLNPYGALIGRTLGIPVVCQVHSSVSPRSYFSRAVFAADRVVVVAKAVAAPWPRLARNRRRLRVVYNGINPASFRFSHEHRVQERKRLGLTDDTFAVGVVSRISPEKGIETLLRSLQAESVSGTRALALVAGDAPPELDDYSARIRRLSEELGVASRVKFLGYVDPISDLYSAFDALVLPSNEEGFPRVVLEAMAAERPVIATLAGGLPEIITHEETGLLVPRQDPEALAAAIARLARDRALCERLGKAGRARVEGDFTLSGYVRAFEHVYGELTAADTQAA